MDQLSLIHEDIYEALRTCVQALGGAKKVGAVLYPELAPDKAGNRLTDALNTAKRDVLNPEQLMLILKMARKIGCHAGMHFITTECEYQRPEPVEPEDELAKLQREYIQAVKEGQALARRMERMMALREVNHG